MYGVVGKNVAPWGPDLCHFLLNTRDEQFGGTLQVRIVVRPKQEFASMQ